MYSFGDTNARLDIARWVGFENYERLFTRDRVFLDRGDFPPEGALVNNIKWAFLYTTISLSLGLLITVLAVRVRYESIVKAIVFVPMAIAADRGRDHLEVRLRARSRHRRRQCDRHELLRHGSDRVPRPRRHGQLRDHLRLRLGVDGLRDGRALRSSQRHPRGDHRGGEDDGADEYGRFSGASSCRCSRCRWPSSRCGSPST